MQPVPGAGISKQDQLIKVEDEGVYLKSVNSSSNDDILQVEVPDAKVQHTEKSESKKQSKRKSKTNDQSNTLIRASQSISNSQKHSIFHKYTEEIDDSAIKSISNVESETARCDSDMHNAINNLYEKL